MKTLVNEKVLDEQFNLMFGVFPEVSNYIDQEVKIEKEVLEETWFVVQKFIKKDPYIQTKINYAKRRSTGLEQYDYESHVLVMCIEFIMSCLNSNSKCVNSENCVSCQVFLKKIHTCVAGYLDKETRNSPISYAFKPFEQYENTKIASVEPDTNKVCFSKEESFDKVEEVSAVRFNDFDDIIDKFRHILSDKEVLILQLYIKGYKPKIIAQLCNFYRVQSVYMSIKRIINKIKMHLNEM